MGLTMMERPPRTPTPPTPPTPIRVWRCTNCHTPIGQIVNGILHERHGDKSNFPVVRRCRECQKVNRLLAA